MYRFKPRPPAHRYLDLAVYLLNIKQYVVNDEEEFDLVLKLHNMCSL